MTEYNKTYYSQEGSPFIVRHKEGYKYLIEFLDSHKFSKLVQKHHITEGSIKNPYFKSVFGEGFFGEGPYKYSTKFYGNRRFYSYWQRMLERVYKPGGNSTGYYNCMLDPSWKNFQTFCHWIDEQPKGDFVLDKDLIIPLNNLYGPSQCCLLPVQINSFLALPYNCKTLGCKVRDNGKWQVRCTDEDGIRRSLGDYTSSIEAVEEYCRFKNTVARKLAVKYEDFLIPAAKEALLKYDVRGYLGKEVY